MPEGQNTGTITIGADFRPAERDALEYFNKTQRLFSKNLNTSTLARPLLDAEGAAGKFERTMASANARVIAFGAAAGIIFQVGQNIKDLALATVEVDRALTNINVLFQKSREEIKSFGAEIFKIAKDTGQSFSTIAAGAEELARQGLGAEDTLGRLRDAAILSRQSGLDLADSVDTLTAAINSFGKSALTSTEIVNKFANVDASFAVSSRDLAEALKRVGSTAQDAGVGIDELIGLVTSAQQTTARGGAVIGNALKTIFTRIERPEVLNQLEQVGVSVRDVGNQIKPTSDILKNFALVFSQASDSQQSYLAELVGSVYQINILKALLGDLSKNYSIAEQATRKSSESQNEAIQRNEEYNKSLASTLNRAKETFRQLGSQIGDLTVAPLVNRTDSLVKIFFGDVGKESNDIGGQIAEGVLKGLGNFISGPGLAGIGILAARLLAGFAAYVRDATADLLGLNKFTKQQAILQKELNSIIANEPGLRDAILKSSISQVEVEKILLSITKQRISEQSKLNAITKDSSSSLLRTGQLSFNNRGSLLKGGGKSPQEASKIVPNYTKSYIPNYAEANYSGLELAIKREKTSGVPESLIRVGQDDTLKSAKNPLGLGVFNLRDEPKGLKDGISRAISMGLDPKTHGLGSGSSIPNYAPAYYENIKSNFSDPFNRPSASLLVSPAKAIEIENAISELKREIKQGIVPLSQIPDAAQKLVENFNLASESSNQIEKRLKSTARFYKQSIDEKVRERTRPDLTLNRGAYGQLEFLPTQAKGQLEFSSILSDVTRGNVQSQSASILDSLMTPTEGDKREAQKKYNELVNDLLFTPSSKQGSAGFRGGQVGGDYERVIKEAANISAISFEKEASLQRGAQAAGRFSSLVPFTQSFKDAQRLKLEDRERFDQVRGQLNNRIGNAAIGVSIGAPIVAGVASQLFRNDSPTQRGLSALLQGGGNIASYAGLGASIGGVPGLAVGAAAGVAFELPAILRAFKDDLPDLVRNLELTNEKFKENSDNLTKYISLEDKLSNVRGLKPEVINRLTTQRSELLASFSDSQRSGLAEAIRSGGVSGGVDFQRRIELDQEKLIKALQIQTLIGSNNRVPLSKASILQENLPKGKTGVEFFQTPEKAKQDAEERLGVALSSGGAFSFASQAARNATPSKRFFTPEELSKSDKISSFLGSTLESGGKSIFDGTSDEIKKLREDLLKSVNAGNTKELVDKLDKLIPNSESGGVLRQSLNAVQSNSPEAFLAYIARFLRENLSENLVKQRSDIEGGIKTENIRRIETLSDFSSKLFKAIEAINSFTLSLENANKLSSQEFQFRAKSNQTLRDGQSSLQAPFLSPLAQERLRRNSELQGLSEQNSIANQGLIQNFSESINKVINTEVINELENKIKEAIGSSDEKTAGAPKEIVDRAFNFTNPIIELNKSIQSNLSKGNVLGAENQIQSLLEYLNAQNQRLLPALQDVASKRDSADLKSLIEKISSGVNISRQQFRESGAITNQGFLQSQFLARLQSAQRENEIRIQRQIGFGGGIQGFLEDPNSFGRNIARSRSFERLGRSSGDSSLTGLGEFERARNLQGLGVDIQQVAPDLFGSLVENLSTSINQALLSAGVDLQGSAGFANSREIALRKLQAEFPTDRAGGIEGLISTSQNLYQSLEGVNSSLTDFVSVATQNGIKIQSSSLQELGNIILPNGAPKGGQRINRLEGGGIAPINPSRGELIRRSIPVGFLEGLLGKDFTRNAFDGLSTGAGRAYKGLEGLVQPFALRIPSENDVGSTVSSRLSSFKGSGEDFRRTEIEALSKLLQNQGSIDNNRLISSSTLNSAFNTQDFDKNALGFYQGLTPDLGDTQERLLSLTSNIEKVRGRMLSIVEKERAINKDLEAGELNILEAARKRLSIREREVSLEARAAFSKGEISGQELNSQLNREAEARIKSNEFNAKDLGRIFASNLTSYGRQDFFSDVKDGAIETARTIKSEFSGAFKDFARGTKDADDAFRSFGLSILERITDISTDISTNLLFSALGSGLGALFGSDSSSGFGSIASAFTKKSGGGIIGYSSGGKVKGGSGTKDDVPALLTEGEYVINKRAVNSIGSSTLDKINDGSFSTIFRNSFLYNNNKRPTGGGFDISPELSSLAQTDEDNPANRLKFQREEELINYLQGRREYDRNRRVSLRNFRRGQDQRTISGFINAGISVGGAGISSYNSSSSAAGSNSYDFNNSNSPGNSDIFNNLNRSYYASTGGMMNKYGVKRYANGGGVFGGDSMTDRVPALLTGGEYVIKKQSVDKYGPDFLSAINKGRIRKFAEGGYVGASQSSGDPFSRIADAIDKLSLLNEKISNQNTNNQSAGNTSLAAAPTNITINVNVENNGNATTSTSDNNQSGNSQNSEDYKKLAEVIKQVVVKEISVQKRPGGLLAS